MTSGTGPTPHGLGSLTDERLGAVVASMAGREALPAAGAAVAVTLSMSAALLEKAASAARNNGAPVDSAAQGRAEHLRSDALALADEDAATHRRVLAARGDAARVQSALAHAAEPVLAMAEIGVKLAQLAVRIHDDVPLRLQGEVRTAGHLASAAARAAAELVAIDLGELSEDARAGRAFELAAEAAAYALTLTERPLRGR